MPLARRLPQVDAHVVLAGDIECVKPLFVALRDEAAAVVANSPVGRGSWPRERVPGGLPGEETGRHENQQMAWGPVRGPQDTFFFVHVRTLTSKFVCEAHNNSFLQALDKVIL